MTRIAWRAWVDFCRRRMSASRALGTPVQLEATEIEAAAHEHGVDLDALELWRFSVCEWFARHQPRCLEPARQLFAGRSWVEAAAQLNERANSLAKRWQRCKERFLDVARADRGELRKILDYFESVGI